MREYEVRVKGGRWQIELNGCVMVRACSLWVELGKERCVELLVKPGRGELEIKRGPGGR